MKKFRCGNCGDIMFEGDLTEVEWTDAEMEEYAHLWQEADYTLSNKQKMFCIDADNCGLDIDLNYSGRGMYGAKCPAVRVDSTDELKTDVGYRQDSMGLGRVLYRP